MVSAATPRGWGAPLVLLLASGLAHAQSGGGAPVLPDRSSRLGWQVCQAMGADATAQLACFRSWA